MNKRDKEISYNWLQLCMPADYIIPANNMINFARNEAGRLQREQQPKSNAYLLKHRQNTDKRETKERQNRITGYL